MRAGALLLALACAAPVAAADEPAQPPGITQGPMTVERTRNGWVIAPDVEVGRVGKTTATHAGAYGGWMFDNTLLLGGAAYWQTNRSAPRAMDYGGAIVEWLAATDHPVGFGARAMIGAGRATLLTSLPGIPVDYDGRLFANGPSAHGLIPVDLPIAIRPTQLRFHDDFVIFEPQADVLLNLGPRLRVRAAAGYRFINADAGWSPELRGATGSIGLEIGGTAKKRLTP